jgi:L1 cell adhesion molecule like protein
MRTSCAVNEAISRLDASKEASTEEYNEKQRELESIGDPINAVIQKLLSQTGAGAAGG